MNITISYYDCTTDEMTAIELPREMAWERLEDDLWNVGYELTTYEHNLIIYHDGSWNLLIDGEPTEAEVTMGGQQSDLGILSALVGHYARS